MDRNLALEFVRVTEAAAIAASKWVGKGEAKKADGAAVDEMRSRFNQIDFSGRVVIGEGSKDEAPELYTGEKVGTFRHSSRRLSGAGKIPELDLAVDPLECTDSVAYGRYNAMSVIAAGPRGSLFSAPDTYMEKIAGGAEAAKVIDLDAPVKVNIQKTAWAQGKKVSEITVIVLDRPRHLKLIQDIRTAGARVRLITDGDVAGAIAPSLAKSGIDLLMGVGASTEAVLAAAAIKVLGGQILTRFQPRDEKDAEKVRRAGYGTKRIYRVGDLARGNTLTFTATGVIDGPLLSGVRFEKNKIITNSVVMRASSRTIRYITTQHHGGRK